ncbi:unnamed protein product [Moneuplotes crassus]|uniref:Uncharacterized protein n=1 Tax=Euplotes crassus TaxID=5936 RepID=A0AAD1Y8M2_EUPCR|nr:unnamed protein product [Moneuplotes crassus]
MKMILKVFLPMEKRKGTIQILSDPKPSQGHQNLIRLKEPEESLKVILLLLLCIELSLRCLSQTKLRNLMTRRSVNQKLLQDRIKIGRVARARELLKKACKE